MASLGRLNRKPNFQGWKSVSADRSFKLNSEKRDFGESMPGHLAGLFNPALIS